MLKLATLSTAPTIVIQDPYHEYGVQFIEHIFNRHGYRAICFYTDDRERMRHDRSSAEWRSKYMAAAYKVAPSRIPEFADHLHAHHDVIAVVPFNEAAVIPAAELADRIGLGWAQSRVLRRFRDKLAMKQHLRRVAPTLRINSSHGVRSTAEVLLLRTQERYQRFVLKPNDGYGNQHIGLFGRDSPAALIDAYMATLPDRNIVMEEYIGGTEYFVNGQIDAHGNVITFAIFEYVRLPANGRHNIDLETIVVRHGTPIFDRLVDYSERIMRATALLRSPFHLELKMDEQGPCLIEVAARLPGHGNALLSGELHGSPLGLIELASHYYIDTAAFGMKLLDWTVYNSQAVRYVHGIAHKRERLYDLEGVTDVEAMPEFHRWVKKPTIGTRVERSVDCMSMPWSCILKAPTESAAAAAADEVRRLIGWNRRVGALKQVMWSVKLGLPRALARLRQTLTRGPLKTDWGSGGT